MSDKRPTIALFVLLAGLTAGFVVAVVSARRSTRPAPSGPPIGRVGERGPDWKVSEKVLIHRSAGEVAQHLHDHGGLSGLSGGMEGPALDRYAWDVEGTGHLEAEVHGLPGADKSELTVRVAPARGGVAQAAKDAVLGSTVRAQVLADLEHVRRVLEGRPGGDRAAEGTAAPGQGA